MPQQTLAVAQAGHPRGSWPRRAGIPAEVVMDLAGDRFLVIVRNQQLAVA